MRSVLRTDKRCLPPEGNEGNGKVCDFSERVTPQNPSCHLRFSLDALRISMETQDLRSDRPEFLPAERNNDGITSIGFEWIALASLVYGARRDSGHLPWFPRFASHRTRC
jgi:hypothetical protein